MVKGIDVSHWEQGFDFVKGVKDGVAFMMTKASEGLGLDQTCSKLCAKAKAAGVQFTGIYHFFHANVSVMAQIATYAKQYDAVKTEMPPIMDLEETSTNGHPDSEVRELALQWLQAAEFKWKRVPILYIDMNMINRLGVMKDQRFQKYPLWVARYNSQAPPMHWYFWQFTDHGEQGADTDWFYGSTDDLAKFIGAA